MHGLVRCTHWVQVFMCTRGRCDNHRCHNKDPREEMGPGTWMTACPEAMGWGFSNLKKTVSWDLDLNKASWFFGPGWGWSSYELRDAHACWLSQWDESWWCTNSQHGKKLCLSLFMSKNLKLKKVIKSFEPELKESRQVFHVIQIPMRMNIMNVFTCSYLGCIFGPICYK